MCIQKANCDRLVYRKGEYSVYHLTPMHKKCKIIFLKLGIHMIFLKMHHGNRHMLSFKIETCATMKLSNLTPPSLRTQTITSSPTVVFYSKDLVTAIALLPVLSFCFGIVSLMLRNLCSALLHSNFTRLCVNYLNKMPRLLEIPNPDPTNHH